MTSPLVFLIGIRKEENCLSLVSFMLRRKKTSEAYVPHEIVIFPIEKGEKGMPLPVLDNVHLEDTEIHFGKVRLNLVHVHATRC